MRLSEADLARLGYRLTPDTARAIRTHEARTALYEPALAADIFPAIKRLATQHGWENRYTYSAVGPDPGLHITLVRDAVLMFYLLDEGEAPTPLQRGWVEALQQTGQVEAALWYPADFETIKTRLTRPRKETHL
jgi:hypothetical protein